MTFPDPDAGKVIPYGVDDLTRNAGWVNVGVDHDNAAFAVQTIRCWWNDQGRIDYPTARALLITADAGGSNSYRTRAWKARPSDLAPESGLHIVVCHFPPGTSKWNKIEHRLFARITMNWRGRPLTSHDVVVQTIASPTIRVPGPWPDAGCWTMVPVVTGQGLRTTFSQFSCFSLKISYPWAASCSGSRWVITRVGSISPRSIRCRSDCM
jgi:hypothetical protein